MPAYLIGRNGIMMSACFTRRVHGTVWSIAITPGRVVFSRGSVQHWIGSHVWPPFTSVHEFPISIPYARVLRFVACAIANMRAGFCINSAANYPGRPRSVHHHFRMIQANRKQCNRTAFDELSTFWSEDC